MEVEGDVFNVKVEPKDGSVKISESGSTEKPKPDTSLEGSVTCNMQGMVLSVDVKVGDQVNPGDTLCVIEAMKMENSVSANHGGVVKEIFVSDGDAVSTGDVLMVIE